MSAKLFKVLVIGEANSGKTSIIQRYVNDKYTEGSATTIGVDFESKDITMPDGRAVRLQFWDIAGQERFGNMTRSYYKEASGCLLVFDSSNSGTLAAAKKWKTDLDSKVRLRDDSRIPVVLLANKCDRQDPDYLKDTIEEWVQNDEGFVGWFASSAKENQNLHEAVVALTKQLLVNDARLPAIPARQGVVDPSKPAKSKGDSPCC